MKAMSADVGVKISLTALLALILWASGASWKVFGYVQMIAANTVAIQNVAKSLELGRVSDEIGDLRKERRELDRKFRREPDNDMLYDQIEEIKDELKELEHQRECIEDPGRKVCDA